jgi:hypothetical protein
MGTYVVGFSNLTAKIERKTEKNLLILSCKNIKIFIPPITIQDKQQEGKLKSDDAYQSMASA